MPGLETEGQETENSADAFEELVAAVRSCRACAGVLSAEPRPVIQIAPSARLLIASQAPGSRVHASGIPFADPSGDRLRAWMEMPAETFYDESRVAILPVGFCYPGRARGGDAPPRRECARLWRNDLLAHLPGLELTLLVGAYAQSSVLGPGPMTERVRGFQKFLPRYFPLPHPSWRSGLWIARNPWFEAEVLPALRRRLRDILG
ncbi:uracil-DNA glycosylase family protein [Sphingobium sp. CFD-2]|uniref:uracil-DNA glycosylase family protein n=1 Tax=Sphingobium sp. CFD-2 TaxID=2878542 RepID=UPI00214C606E|nr:uracil-DNA glycosylase family protein [Sphingobium sp. CFD-2]